MDSTGTFGRPGKAFRPLLRLAACMALCAVAVAGLAPAGEKGREKATVDADLLIPKKDVSTTARYYPVEIDGYRMEVIAVQAPDKSIRVVFNACQVCFAGGKGIFDQKGSELVCRACGNGFATKVLEVSRGGCNPIPVGTKNRQDDGTNIILPKAFLERARAYFVKLG